MTYERNEDQMVDNSWMQGALRDDHEGSFGLEGVEQAGDFEVHTVRSTIASIQGDPSLTWTQMVTQVNEAIGGESLNLRYEQAMAATEVEALRSHVYSPNVMNADPTRRHQSNPEELEHKAVDIEEGARTLFEDGRRVLVEQVSKLHEEGFPFSATTWADVYALDDDGYVSTELAEHGGQDELVARAQEVWPRIMDPYTRPTITSVPAGAAPEAGIDLRRGVPQGHPPVERELEAVRDRSPQEHRQVQGPSTHVEAQDLARDAEQDGEVSATIERHRQQARSRRSGEPRKLDSTMADFFRQHGRSPVDGSRLEDRTDQQDLSPDDSPEL